MVRILVTGASGSVGRHVAAGLAALGHDVRAMTRSGTAAGGPTNIEVVQGDLAVPETLRGPLLGVDRVYLMWPGIAVEPRAVELIAGSAGRVVYLSTDVADLETGESATHFHQEVERLIRMATPSWTFLRAIDFATNALAWSSQVKDGVVRWPYGRAARSLIHEQDIADVAVRVLTSDGHDGAKYVLTGPEAIEHAELVRIIGKAIGRVVRWEDLPPEAAREQLTAAWGNPAFVDSRLRAWAAFAQTPERVTDTVQQLLGRPARSFREWARDHAEDFR